MDYKTVPVMIDDRKNISNFKMTRVTYFYIEAIEPSPDIPLKKTSIGSSILTLEFSGVIYKPLGRSSRFKTAKQIEKLFQGVERHETLYVDSDNIWIPNLLFNKPPKRADIFRVPFELFARLYTLCKDDATLAAGINQIEDSSGLITLSEEESSAFAEWTTGIVTDAKAAYPKNKNLALTWR